MNIGMTLVIQAIGFAIFALITYKFVWPPLNDAIETRRKKILENLAEAEKSKTWLAKGEMLKEASDTAADRKAL